MSLIGYADLDRPIAFEKGQVFYPFGGGPFRIAPWRCSVVRARTGLLDFRLELVRALPPGDSYAFLALAVGADYDTAGALAKVREVSPTGSLTGCVLTDWWFRLAPEALQVPDELNEPQLLSSDGLGGARMLSRLSIDSGVLLETMVRERSALCGVAEAQFEGVSPRVPAVVEFNSAEFLDELLAAADDSGALPRQAVVGYFAGDLNSLPIDISGPIDGSSIARFAETMADRTIARFGQYVPPRELEDGPVVRLAQPGADVWIRWALSQPFLAKRRLVLPIDLLTSAQAQVDQLGMDSIVVRRAFTALPSLGKAQVTVLCNLPTIPQGVDALGVTLTFPPHPRNRPQARIATAVFDSASDIAVVDVTLSPNEPVRYRYSAFAVISDAEGTRQVDAPEREWEGSPLRLSPEHFPIELALVEVTPALNELAVLFGTLTYEAAGRTHLHAFRIDSGQRSVAIAMPRERTSLRLECVAVARNGSGEITLDPFESPQVQLDVSTLHTYGPQRRDIRVVFDDAMSQRTIECQPVGSSGEENVTALSFTPATATRTYRWFAASPFEAGFRYRVVDRRGGTWTEATAGAQPLVLYSSRLYPQEAGREVAAKSGAGIREVMPVRPSRNTESTATILPEAAVVPVANSPEQNPTDGLVYTKIGDTPTPLFVPRYTVDMQIASGQPRYRLALVQRDSGSHLEVNLLAAKAPALVESARDAQEYPHTLTIHLEYLVAPPSGAKKTLDLTDVTRNGEVVTALLPFATVAERDEVYRALTEPDRRCTLMVRRFIDVSVPYEPSPPKRPSRPGGGFSHGDIWLPPRPIGPGGPKLVSFPLPKVNPNPVLAAATPAVTVVPAVFAARSQPVVLSGVAKGAVLSRRESGVLARSAVAIKARPNLTHFIRVPVDRFVETLPTPSLVFAGGEDDAGQTRLRFSVANWAEFADSFFAVAPELPPGGLTATASRTWVTFQDADTGAGLYSFCAIRSGQELWDLNFVLPQGQAAPAHVNAKMIDRRTKSERTSNAVDTAARQVPADTRPRRPVRQELPQAVAPEPFAFSAALHGYIFQGLTPGGGGNTQLTRHRLSWGGRFHTYLQDASRPSLVYFFADRFKMARRRDEPFTPFATVRLKSRPDASITDVVFDYVIAPYTDPKRLEQARAELLASPHFGATAVDFQPFLTSDVRFLIDRPTESGSVREERAGAGIVLQGALKDTLTMTLGDFRLLFDAMHRRTASLFLGRVEVAVPHEDTEVIPFEARLDDLEGDIFSYEAAQAADGRLQVTLTNQIESPVSIQTLDATILNGTQRVRGVVEGSSIPCDELLPAESIQVTVTPQSPGPAAAHPQVSFDLGGVSVLLDVEQAWNTMLDRSTLDYFRTVTVKAVPTLFNPVAGRENEQIVSILVEFEGGGTAELSAATLEAKVRVDYPIDDVILNRPVATSYRYTVTVVRANNRQDRDPQPRDGAADVFFVSAIR